MIKHAIILAAGRGMRLMPLTQTTSKAMIKVNGNSLISYSIEQLRKTIPHVAITVGYKGDEVARHVIEEGVASVFNTSGHGNSWWIFNTLMKHIDEPVLVLTCDNIVQLNMDFLYNSYADLGNPPVMVVPVVPVEGIEGDFIRGDNGLVTMLSRNIPTDAYCSGIQVINPCQVNKLMKEGDDFYDVWGSLIEQQRLCYSGIYPYAWYSINTVEQLEQVASFSQTLIY